MREELVRHTHSKSDDQLYDMLYLRREDWTPEALEVAEQEWQTRNLDANKVVQAQAVALTNENERMAVAEEPLSPAQKVAFFVFNYAFCLGIVQVVIADIVFKGSGYDRKFRDCLKWMAFGFAFYCVVIGLFYWIPLLCSALSSTR